MYPPTKGTLLGGSNGTQVFRVGDQVLKVSTTPAAAKELEEEGRLLCSLRHPHLLPGISVVKEGDQVILTTPYAQGESLKDRLQQGPLPLAESLRICREVLDALDYLHIGGVRAHRDLKPANVLLDENGSALLADLGSALLEDSPAQHSPSFVGTLAYAAPEQLKDSAQADERSDIFALGSILFEMVEGSRWMQGSSGKEIYRAKMRGKHPGPLSRSQLPPQLKSRIQAVIQHACASRPQDRYPDFPSFDAALKSLESALLLYWMRGPLIGAAAIFALLSGLALGVAGGLILLPVG